MDPIAPIAERLARAVDRRRLVETAIRLIEVPSPTGEGGAAADRLAELLAADGFAVDRPEADHPTAPAVVARLRGARPGRTIQFNGHLDVVHLPFVPPRVEGDLLRGSGSCDMKGGLAAAVEAFRALRDAGVLSGGSVLLTAHDLHEAPWGDGRQLDRLITDGVRGDAVLIPEPISDRIPVVGRGQGWWKATIRRSGPPIHEVMRPLDEPSVLAAGAELIARLGRLDTQLRETADPLAGPASAFIGQFHGGEIYNSYPHDCWLEGTRRWLPGTSRHDVERDLRGLVADLERDTGTTIDLKFRVVRDAFALDRNDPLVSSFQRAHEVVTGHPLPIGPKPFVDDGNSFCALGRMAAISHGPKSGGQHTVEEWASIDDLVRLATLYALTAVLYCGAE
jgi:acetylornithine deacetylase/succinyl-diaminopimelate desuccinylase-like protein